MSCKIGLVGIILNSQIYVLSERSLFTEHRSIHRAHVVAIGVLCTVLVGFSFANDAFVGTVLIVEYGLSGDRICCRGPGWVPV